MAVELTEKQKNSPLYKYYEMPIDRPSDAEKAEIFSMTFDESKPYGLAVEDINLLLEDGYMDNEFGLFCMKDGGRMFANLTDMPGVTPEMWDWWFAWHGLDDMRYIIWDKEDHYDAKSLNKEQNLNTELSMKERYWNTTHEVHEGLLEEMPPVPVHLTFVHPTQVGFDAEKLKDFKGTIIATPGPAIMVHFVRPTETGCELRTRFWFGYQSYPDGRVEKVEGFPPCDENMARALLYHNMKEFRHLAKILPLVYNEFKDDFLVGLE